MKKSKDLGAQDAIDVIKDIKTVEALADFVNDEETRKTVLAAHDARYAELTEGTTADATEDEAVEYEADAPEEDAENEDETPSEEEVEEAFGLLDQDVFATIIEVVKVKIAIATTPVDTGVQALIDAIAPFEKSTVDEASGNVAVYNSVADDLFQAVVNQVTLDANRRGMSQPCKEDADMQELAELFAEAQALVNEETETEAEG